MGAEKERAGPDPRRHAFRKDLADIALRERVAAGRFVEATEAYARRPITALRRRPDSASPRDTEVLFGERLHVFDVAAGWAWVQILTDGYVGYVPEDALARGAFQPSHRVRSRSVVVYAEPSALSEPLHHLPLNAEVRVAAVVGAFAGLEGGGFVGLRHLARAEADFAGDPVRVAESFLGVPYLFGGRSALGGIDCSGLVQMALAAAGIRAPRDSDMQCEEVGRVAVDESEEFADFRRGDLVFWPGHVAILCSADEVVHASAANMCVAREPLAVVADRSRKAGARFGRVRRL